MSRFLLAEIWGPSRGLLFLRTGSNHKGLVLQSREVVAGGDVVLGQLLLYEKSWGNHFSRFSNIRVLTADRSSQMVKDTFVHGVG
jgi:hypothetical protein